VLTPVCERRQTERNTLRHSQPVQILQQRRHVLVLATTEDQTRRRVQHRLELVNVTAAAVTLAASRETSTQSGHLWPSKL